jgi:hypothetical protein
MATLILKDKTLSKLTNLVGTDYTKIYNKYFEDYQDALKIIKENTAVYESLENGQDKIISEFLEQCNAIIYYDVPEDEGLHLGINNLPEIKIIIKEHIVNLYNFMTMKSLNMSQLLIENTDKWSWILPRTYQLYGGSPKKI